MTTKQVAKMLCALVMISVLWKEALCIGGAEEMKALHRSLFTDYDPSVVPNHEYRRPIDVTVQLFISTVMGLDTKHQLLNLKAFIRTTWIDELLQWRPEDHGNFTEVLVPQSKIWKPDVYLSNAAEDVDYIGGENVLASIGSDGYVRWEPGFSVKTVCKVDVSKYPFDVNVCPVSIVTWMHDNTKINLMWPDAPVDLSNMVTNGEYKITPAGAEKVIHGYGDSMKYEIIHLRVRLARRPMYIIMSVVVPITMLAVLSLLSFIMSPDAPEKVTVSITVLLSFTVFLNVIDSSIPQTSETLSLLVVYVTALVGQSFLSVVGSVLVLTVHEWDEKKKEKKLSSRGTDAQSETYTNSSCQEKEQSAHLMTNSVEASKHPQSKIRYSLRSSSNDSSLTNTPAYRLNKAFLVFNCTTLLLITSIVGILMLL